MRAERRSEAWLRLFCKAEWRDVDLFLEVEDGFDVALLLGVSRAELGSLLRPRRGPLRICRRLSLLDRHTSPAAWDDGGLREGCAGIESSR